MSKNILVTAIGTMTSTAIVTALRRGTSHRIFGANIFPAYEVATSKDVDEFHVFPSVLGDQQQYLEFVLSFCMLKRIDYYFASIDEEVVLLSKNRALFEAAGVKLCIPNAEVVEICHYKDRFSVWLQTYMPTIAIRTYAGFNAIPETAYPLFVKPVEGRASIGCQKVATRSVAEELLAGGFDERNFVIQEFYEGEHITVDLVRDAVTGRSFQLQRKELQRNSNGCGIAVEIIADKKLQQICQDLSQRLNLNGVANAEFFRRGGEYRCIEVNPRFSAGTEYSCMAGLNTVLNALSIVEGEGCSQCRQSSIGRHFAKRYETYQMD